MSRINTNVSSLIAQNNLKQSNADMQVRLQRLSTGLRINRGADDPAGLIVSERLRSEMEGIGQAIENGERASNVIATTEGSLAEVSQLLTQIKSLIIETANDAALSASERQANQLQIDSAVESITRISNTASFAGLKLLNGSLDYVTTGIANSAITDVQLNSVNFGTAASISVTTEVIASAEVGSLFLSTGAATIPSAVTIEVAGNNGVQTLNFGSGTAISAVVFAVNQFSDSTGVTATLTSGAGGAGTSAVNFGTADYGSDQFVSVQRLGTASGDFFQTYTAAGGSAANRDTGADVQTLVNGVLASSRGTEVSIATGALDLELELTDAYATATGNVRTFTIQGGGARFQLGQSVNSGQQVNIGIQSVAASRLGNASVGFLSDIKSDGSASLILEQESSAERIVDIAIDKVSTLRGRLGAFERNTLETSIRSLQSALENITASESRIRDADFAAETSKLTRAQILTNAGTSVLAQANSQAQNVLALLQ